MNAGVNCLHFIASVWTMAGAYLLASILTAIGIMFLKCTSDPVTLLLEAVSDSFQLPGLGLV